VSKSDPNYVPVKCVIDNEFSLMGLIPDMNAPLLSLASTRFAGRLSVAFQNLDLRFNANSYPVYAAQTWGTTIGYQTNDYDNFHRAACSGDYVTPGACTAATYLQLLERGIYPLGKNNSLRAEYIEVLPPDAVAFPSAILAAHQELTQ